MTKYQYKVVYSSKFKKSLKKVLKQEKDIEKLRVVVEKLAAKEKLDFNLYDHILRNNKYFKGCRECHIEPDWLLVYKYEDDKLILLLVDTGSHSEVLNI